MAGVAIVSGITGVTVKNLTITKFWHGLVLWEAVKNSILNIKSSYNANGIFSKRSSFNTIAGSTFAYNNTGISISYAGSNRLDGNLISYNNCGIDIRLSGCNYNYLNANIINDNQVGVSIWEANENLLSNNTISDNGAGVWVIASNSNKMYNNNIINNDVRVLNYSMDNIFALYVPVGGNYWNYYDDAAEGCNDSNGDGFCDFPFSFDGGVDSLPWTEKDGWLSSPEAIIVKTKIEIQQILSWGEISEGSATSLSKVLDSALAARQKGNERAGDKILLGFIKQVEGQAKAGRIAEEAAGRLIEAAKQTISN